MVKARKSMLLLVVAMLILSMGLMLVACNEENTPNIDNQNPDTTTPSAKPGEYTVTFMFKDGVDSQWKEYKKVNSDKEGKLILPEDPEVYGYSFRAWYKEDSFTNKFDGTGVTSDMKVYAKMADKLVTVKISDVDGSERVIEKQAMAGLDKLKAEEEAKAVEANLTFDSYYTNPECTTPYLKDSENTVIYARFVATVVFNNGYEDMRVLKVIPGSKIEEPVLDDSFVKFYMSKLGISYQNDDKSPFAFDAKITHNTNVNVKWQTPGLRFEGNLCKGVDFGSVDSNLKIKQETFNTFPVISIPGKGQDFFDMQGKNDEEQALVPYNDIEVAELSNVTGGLALRKVIIGDGIKMVSSLSQAGTKSNITSVDFGSTVEIISESLNGLDELKSIELPQSAQIIMDSMWSHRYIDGYDFEITIPAGVKNLIRVPANIVGAEGSKFYAENNAVYANDPVYGKTIVAVNPEFVVDGSVTIPEGVEAIQVGMFEFTSSIIDFDYLVIPTTFAKVAYTEDKGNYTYYKSNKLTILNTVDTPEGAANGFAKCAYSIISKAQSTYKAIIASAAQLPEGINQYAFTDSDKSVTSKLVEDNKIIFLNEIKKGEALSIKASSLNTMTNTTTTATIAINSGDVLTQEKLFTELKITEKDLGFKPIIKSVRSFGKDLDLTQPLNKNIMIDVQFAQPATGIVTSENEDGTLTVTGATDGATVIIITDDIDGKKIVAIADEAFMDNKTITDVMIGANVKSIGARAFKNVSSLKTVGIAEGSLAKIGASAFENAGTVDNGLLIQFPLSNLGNGLAEDERAIGAYAFNTPAFKKFIPVESEADRVVDHMNFAFGNLKTGNYYFAASQFDQGKDWGGGFIGKGDTVSVPFGIFKVVAKDDAVSKMNIDYVATAPGYKDLAYSGGQGTSTPSIYFGFKGQPGSKQIIDTHILEGSVQLYTNFFKNVVFVSVTKVDAKAFTNIDASYEDAGVFNFMAPVEGLNYTKEADMKAQNTDIFTEGWFNGRANAENKFMANVVEYAGIPGYNPAV